jgi:lysophospholipase L1-like esterase
MAMIQQLQNIPLTGGPIDFRGALELEATAAGILPRRLPAWTRAQYQDPSMERQVTSPSGVRLALRTSAATIELDVLTTVQQWPDQAEPPTDAGAFELVIDGETVQTHRAPVGDILKIADFHAVGERIPGPVGTVRFEGLPARDKDVEIWLPHQARTELVALRADAPVASPTTTGLRRWVHHGSSISQCGEAATPTGIWPAVAARLARVDVVNLGLGGNCYLDPFVARTIRDAPADLISLKLGINLTSRSAFRTRTFSPTVHGFLDTVREGHPDTPLLVVSPIICPALEDRPGPAEWGPDGRQDADGGPDDIARGALTLTIVRAELRRIVAERAEHDSNLHYLDGLALFGPADAPGLPDGLHPGPDGYRLIGERFAALAFGPDGAFS